MMTRTWFVFFAGAVLIVVVSIVGTVRLSDTWSATDEDSITTPGIPRFMDVTARTGITFRHYDPATPDHLLPETMGSGVAWIDYDADGWPDLFCVQAGPVPPGTIDNPPTHKLYRNNCDGTFTDVTLDVGLNIAVFGMGVAVGDYDNDGYDDLLVTHLGGIALYRNEPNSRGGRRFADVTKSAGLLGTNPHWGTSCAWIDIDGDGFLDLYVCNYCEIDPNHPLICKHPATGTTFQCAPSAYPHTTHRLYRNNGDGTFTDVSGESGISKAAPAPGLGVVTIDLDGDGRQDIYVANDLAPAYLFRNKGKGMFDEVALPSGSGLGPGGARMSGMGVEAGDLDGSGRPSLFITNFQNVPNVVFFNRGGLRFIDATTISGLGPPSLMTLGFGTALLDADLDGNIDIAVANGHVQRSAPEILRAPYAQSAQLFLGNGQGKFRDASTTAGRDFLVPRVGRGLARCDFDNDGKPDLVLSGVGEPTVLLRNITNTTNAWISLELIGDGKTSNRNAIGAVVQVQWADHVRTHFITGGGSYLSAHDRRLALGLGPDTTKLDRVTVRWPSGRTQEFSDLAAGAFWRLHEGRVEPERFVPSKNR